VLQRLNDIAPGEVIQPGQRLKIPSGAEPTPGVRLYTVQRGDTLSSIAEEFGTTVDEIKRLNNMSGSFIRTGQVLRIPE
jgi:membrane-bound lytic murein transglycosylase D